MLQKLGYRIVIRVLSTSQCSAVLPSQYNPPFCYDHALLVTGYDVLLLTLQGNLSFSTSSASSFASTHAGLDCFSLLDLYPRHLAYRTHASNPHHVYCLTDSLVPLISSSHSP